MRRARRHILAAIAIAGLGMTLAAAASAAALPPTGTATAGTAVSETEAQSTITEAGPPEGIEEPDLGTSITAGVHYGGPITRAEVIRRAKNWSDRNIQYSQANYAWDINNGRRYRTDCSGFVSMAWALTTSRTTLNLHGVATRISWPDLKPGDMILLAGTHVQLFEKWANANHTVMWIYEEASPDQDMNHETISLAYLRNHGYVPWTYNNIHDDVPPPAPQQSSDVNGDGFGDVVAFSRDAGNNGQVHSFGGHRGGIWETAFAQFGNSGHWANGKLTVANIDGDGYADMVMARPEGAATKLEFFRGGADNKLRRTTSRPSTLNAAFDSVALASGDVNGDGFGDVVAFSRDAGNNGQVHSFGGHRGGIWETAFAQFGNSGHWANGKLTVANIDGDGYADMVMARPEGAATKLEFFRGGADNKLRRTTSRPSTLNGPFTSLELG
jgi:hypothetical protein